MTSSVGSRRLACEAALMAAASPPIITSRKTMHIPPQLKFISGNGAPHLGQSLPRGSSVLYPDRAKKPKITRQAIEV